MPGHPYRYYPSHKKPTFTFPGFTLTKQQKRKQISSITGRVQCGDSDTYLIVELIQNRASEKGTFLVSGVWDMYHEQKKWEYDKGSAMYACLSMVDEQPVIALMNKKDTEVKKLLYLFEGMKECIEKESCLEAEKFLRRNEAGRKAAAQRKEHNVSGGAYVIVEKRGGKTESAIPVTGDGWKKLKPSTRVLLCRKIRPNGFVEGFEKLATVTENKTGELQLAYFEKAIRVIKKRTPKKE